MRLKTLQKAAGSFLLAGLLAIPGFAAQQYDQTNPYSQNGQSGQVSQRGPAAPGTLNYIEGQVELGGQTLSQNSVGTQLRPGETLTTQDGRAEVLLTPGVLLRVDKNSAVTADSMELGSIHFTVQQGRAMVEADQILKDDHIEIAVGGTNARLVKKGLYEFSSADGVVRVWDGQAKVAINGKEKSVYGGHQLAVNVNNKTKIEGFKKKADEDAFYRWSSLRSAYLAEANVKTAGSYADGGMGWYGPGWYWSPWFSAYTWIPGDGIFWDPFGWGFFAPGFVGYAPYYGYGGLGYGGYGYGYGNRPVFNHGFRPGFAAHNGFAGREFHGGAAIGGARGFAGSRVGGFGGGGFHGGGFSGGGVRGGGFGGGGFHGGGGGFHGGGGGGRR